ncbi:MAG: nitrilase-related carbon-nitrogen hydrolase [Candidatus Thorarchaeota archaeon]
MMRIGIGQFAPKLLDCEFNRQQAQAILQEATSAEVDVLVIPELANSGYAFQSKEETMGTSENITSGMFCETLRDWSTDNRLVVSGICEEAGEGLFNSAVAFANGKHVATYRKLHLFNQEKEWFQPGQEEPPVIVFRNHHFGIMVCWDWAFPEMARILAIKGAQVILHPSNLVLSFCQSAMRTRSIENGIFTVTANRIGEERSLSFSGKSQITDTKGELLLQFNEVETGVKSVDFDPSLADNKMLTERNHLLDDRKPEFYKRLTERS